MSDKPAKPSNVPDWIWEQVPECDKELMLFYDKLVDKHGKPAVLRALLWLIKDQVEALL
jgi:hypothetical protein